MAVTTISSVGVRLEGTICHQCSISTTHFCQLLTSIWIVSWQHIILIGVEGTACINRALVSDGIKHIRIQGEAESGAYETLPCNEQGKSTIRHIVTEKNPFILKWDTHIQRRVIGLEWRSIGWSWKYQSSGRLAYSSGYAIASRLIMQKMNMVAMHM